MIFMLPIYPLHGTEKVVNVESLAALPAHMYALGMRCCPGQTINHCKLLRYCGTFRSQEGTTFVTLTTYSRVNSHNLLCHT